MTTGAGLSITDNGAGSTLQINITGAVPSFNSSGNGIQVKTGINTVIDTSLSVGAGLSIINPDGTTGSPTISLGTSLSNLSSMTGTGIIAIQSGVYGKINVLGTANQISVTNGNGATDVGIGLVSNPIIPGNGSITIPVGTTLQRAGSFGALRYNTNLQEFEGFGNTGWVQFAISGGVTSFSAGTTGLLPNAPTAGAITLSGVLNSVNGGTGAAGLTGYMYGNGASPVTASTTIPTTVLSGTVTNVQLANSAITINGNSVSLGGSTTVTASTTSTLTIGTGLSGTSFNGSSPVTIAISNVPVANGGTGLSSGTSGGVLGFTATGTIASSGLLAANALVVGGGAGVLPSTVASLGTTTTVLHGNASGNPTWSAVSLVNDITGTLAETNGGTNQSTYTLGDTLYASATNTLSKLAGNTTVVQKFLSQTGDGTNSGAPSWQVIPTAGQLTYYFTPTSSDVATYFQQTVSPYSPKTAMVSASISGSGPFTIFNYATNAGNPNLSFIPAGEFVAHIHAFRTNAFSGSLTLECQFWEVNSSGVDIALIVTADSTVPLGLSEVEYQFDAPTANVYTMTSTSSRVVARIRVNGTASVASTVTIYVGGVSDSHISLPSNTVDATNFVPYTGATKSLDMGSFNVTANQFTSTVVTGTAPLVVASTTAVANLTATNAVNVGITANSANATNYLTFVSATSGNLPELVNSSITCNPSTGAITGGTMGGAF